MNNIDNRIVNMQFNNQQFENGVKTSVKSLDNLKKGLDLDGATKSLNGLSKASNSFSLAGMANNVDAIAQKFTNLGMVGVTAIQNLTNRAIDAGVALAKSLTIDPLSSGFSEYEIKMNAIQTMLTNTEDKGTTLDDVNKSLNELNEYADKTIYNFAQMTDNVGKFTAAGVGLEDSTIMVQGLANVAAGFGVDAERMAGATYQMTQALSAGYVQLMDWKSLEIAGMGGPKLQKEMVATAKGMGIFVDESIPFRRSLEQGWLTSEVFVATMKKMAADKSLLAAAQNVTTFTKLLSTMKEAVGSGWAATWEQIIGDKAQSTALFTGISDAFGAIVGTSAKARNAMLAFWSANGGRVALLEGIGNALRYVSSILKPIERAFSEIFKPMTADVLISMSKAFKDLTAKFKMGDETLNNIYRTFKGLFAIVSVGKSILMNFGSSIGDSGILKYLKPLATDLLKTTAVIGDFFVKLDSALQTSESFAKIAESIGVALKPIIDLAKNLASRIFELVSSFSLFESGTINLDGILGKLLTSFSTIGNKISEVFKSMIDNILAGFNAGNYSSILGVINTGVFASIIVGLKGFISGLKSGVGQGLSGGFMTRFIDTMDGLRDTLTSFQGAIKATTIMTIALAVGVLAGSLFLIASIDPVQMKGALGAITVLLLELVGTMALLNKIVGMTGFASIGKITLSMLAMSASILVLAFAMRVIAKLDWEQIGKGLGSIAILSLILVGSSKLLEKSSGSMIKSSVGFVIFGLAMIGFSVALARMGALDLPTIGKGLLAIGGLMTGLALFMKITNLSGMGITKSIGVLALAASISILSDAVTNFSKLNPDAMIQGLLAVGVILTQIGLFFQLTSGAKNVVVTAAALFIVSKSLVVLSTALASMGAIPMENIGRGLLVMAGALTIIGVVSAFMSGKSILAGVGLLIIANALIVLTSSLTTMGNMSWEAIARGLTMLAGSMLIIGLAIRFLQTSITGIVALFMMADALSILAPLLTTLGAMSMEQIGMSLLALAGAFTILGAAGFILTPLSGALLAVSSSLFIFSLSMIGASTAMFIFAVSLASIVATFTAGGLSLTMFSSLLGSIIATIPMLFKNLATGIVEGVKIIGDGADVIGKALIDIFKSIAKFMVDILPEIIKLVADIIVGILDSLSDATPKLVDSGLRIINALLLGLEKGIYGITNIAIKILIKFLQALDDSMDIIIQAGIAFIISFIDGISKGIEANSDKIVESIGKLIASIIKLLIKGVKQAAVELANIGQMIQDLIFEGMSYMFGDPRKQVIVPIVEGLESGVSDEQKRIRDAGKLIGDQLLAGSKESLDSKSPSKEYNSLGVDAINGLINGIDKNMFYVYKRGYDIGDVAKQGTKDGLAGISGFLDLLAAKLTGNVDKVKKETTKSYEDVGKGMSSGAEKGTKEASKQAKSAFEISKDWIDEQKYYNNLNLNEELTAWERIQGKYKIGSDERKEAAREIYRLNQEIMTKSLDDEDAKNKKSYDKLVKNIDNMRFYKQISLEEELRLWEINQTTFSAGSQERVNAEKEVFRLKEELQQKSLDLQEKERQDKLSKDFKDIENKKLYSQMTLKEELDALLKIRNLRTLNSEEMRTINQNIFTIRQAIHQKELSDAKEEVETKKFYGQMTLQQELDAELEIRKTKNLTSEEMKESEKKEFTLREAIRAKEISDLQKAIADKKELNKSSLSEELAAQREIRDNKNANTEDILAADKEIARIEKEINDTNLDYTKKVKDLEAKTNDERIKMEEEYYKKTTEINKKLKEDVRKVGEEYTKALESRSKTLYDSFGLFDKVDPKKLVKGSTLVKNLQGQVKEFETWQSNINLLGSKGVSKGLIDELQAMGPKATAEIKALNTLSTPELDLYVSLWKTKHEEAKTQATKELEGLRLETVSKIKELETAAQGELSTYTQTWFTALEKLRLESGTQLDTLALEWAAKIGPIRTATETEFTTMITNVSTSITDPNWSSLGAGIVEGVRGGIQSQAAALASETAAMMIATLNAAKAAIGMASPSKKFAEIGMFSVLGLVQGLRSYTGNAVIAVKDLANTTLSALGLAMAETSSVMADSLDTNPVIRPVLDLSDITSGASRMSALLSGTSGINVGSVNAKIPVMTQPDSVVQSSQNGSTSAPNIAFTQNNYSPKELSRFEIYRQTRNQLATMKGLVSST